MISQLLGFGIIVDGLLCLTSHFLSHIPLCKVVLILYFLKGRVVIVIWQDLLILIEIIRIHLRLQREKRLLSKQKKNLFLQSSNNPATNYNYPSQIQNLTMFLTKIIKRNYLNIKVPTIDIAPYLTKTGDWQQDCKSIAQIFRQYGLAVVKDPRVDQQQNNQFLDLMERYFVRRSQQYRNGNKTIDFSPETNYQVGIMHEYQEKFQSYQEEKLKLKQPNQSLTPIVPSRDPKWRFHWKVNHDKNVIPSDFPEWESTMNAWGNSMRNGCLTVAQMIALGLGLEQKFLYNTIVNGAFHLAPTAVDLQRTKVGDVLAAFHRDFDLLTIHGKSRFPGLFAWLNTGQKFMVHVPDGHLLIQAGKQLQWFTGGQIKAGFHEVVFTDEVEKAKAEARKRGSALWRISSTMFCQVEDKVLMEPHQNFWRQESKLAYPPITALEYLKRQLYALTGKG